MTFIGCMSLCPYRRSFAYLSFNFKVFQLEVHSHSSRNDGTLHPAVNLGIPWSSKLLEEFNQTNNHQLTCESLWVQCWLQNNIASKKLSFGWHFRIPRCNPSQQLERLTNMSTKANTNSNTNTIRKENAETKTIQIQKQTPNIQPILPPVLWKWSPI